MVSAYYMFHYIDLIVFPEMSMQTEALCPPVSETESIDMQYCFIFIKCQNNFIMDADY